jgi:hypothetical protein
VVGLSGLNRLDRGYLNGLSSWDLTLAVRRFETLLFLLITLFFPVVFITLDGRYDRYFNADIFIT